MIFCAFYFSTNAQATFNKRLHFGYYAAVLTSVIPTDSGYIATGILADTISPYNTGALFSMLDLQGDPIFTKTLTSTIRTYEPWFNSLEALPDSSYIVTAVSYKPKENAMIIKYDPNGDTIFTRSYMNPLSPEFDRIQPWGGLTQLSDGGFILPAWINSHPIFTTVSNVYFFKIDSVEKMEWDNIYTSSPISERPTSRTDDGNGNTFIGWTKYNKGNVFENFTFQIRIIKINESGETLWEYESPDSLGLLDAPNDMVLLDDGSLVIATGIGTEIERPTSNTVYFDKYLIKLKPDKKIEWTATFPDAELNVSSKLTNVISLSDGSGFVTAGMEAEDLPGNDTYAIRGWVGKVSPQGQKLWSRAYVGIGGDQPRHTIYDLKETPDGGIILVGESRDGTGDTSPPQQAWLLKLDQHGCLVPGCNLLDDVDEATEQPIELAIYPNPATDYLNFQLRNNQLPQGGTFRIVDMGGRIVHSFPISRVHASDTFILPVWDWTAGTYSLQYLLDGRVVVSEKFIKL